MTAITFPNSPSSGDTHTAGNGIVYTYDGEKWTSIGTNSAGTWTRSGTEVSLTNAGDDLNVDSGTLFVDASADRVGVGTSSPDEELDVQAASNATIRVKSTGTSSGDNALIDCTIGGTDASSYLRFGDSANNGVGHLRYNHSDDSLAIRVNADDRVTIDSSGNLGIGTTSPATNGALTVSMNATAEQYVTVQNTSNYGYGAGIAFKQALESGGSVINSGRILSDWESTNNSLLSFYTTGSGTLSERMRIDSSGNVGIGTTSVDANLHVKGGFPTVHIERDSDVNYSRLLLDNTANDGGAIDGLGDGVGGLRFLTSDAGTINERMRIDSSGRVVIGNQTPMSDAQLTLSHADTVVLGFQRADAGKFDAGIKVFDGHMTFLNGSSQSSVGALSERMRIDSSGNVLVGTTSYPTGSANGSALNQSGQLATSRATTGATTHIAFYNPNGVVGSIGTSGTSTSYNTSSDHRLKENVVDIADGITRVKQLHPKRFNFIADADTTVDGFLAHEAQTVVPEAVTGTHNEVDDDGNPVYQGIDQSKLVPLLTAALQEAIAKIETLEQRLSDAGIA